VTKTRTEIKEGLFLLFLVSVIVSVAISIPDSEPGECEPLTFSVSFSRAYCYLVTNVLNLPPNTTYGAYEIELEKRVGSLQILKIEYLDKNDTIQTMTICYDSKTDKLFNCSY